MPPNPDIRASDHNQTCRTGTAWSLVLRKCVVNIAVSPIVVFVAMTAACVLARSRPS